MKEDIKKDSNLFTPNDTMNNINDKILQKNNIKKSTSILSNLYRIDDRAIKFKQARNELMKLTNDYLSKHFEKESNSRDLINSIEEAEWLKKKNAKR